MSRPTGRLPRPDRTSSHAHHAQRPAWLANWLSRHRHPVSFWLHVIGIPMAVACAPIAIVQFARDEWHLWWRPVALLAGGYLLQWIGHRVEGNDMGEIILLKKILGRPYTAVSPKYLDDPSQGSRGNRKEKTTAGNE